MIHWNPFYSLRLQMWKRHTTSYVNPENLPCVPIMWAIAMQFPKFIDGRERFCNNRNKSLWKMGSWCLNEIYLCDFRIMFVYAFLFFVNTVCLDTYRNSIYCVLSKWHIFAHLIFLLEQPYNSLVFLIILSNFNCEIFPAYL